MVVRILFFLLGAGLAGGGGYLGWLHSSLLPKLTSLDPQKLLPVNPSDPMQQLVAGIGAAAIGVIFLLIAIWPGNGSKKKEKAALAEKRAAAVKAADTLYSDRAAARADRANARADRDWRSGDLPPEGKAAPPPAPAAPQAKPTATAAPPPSRPASVPPPTPAAAPIPAKPASVSPPPAAMKPPAAPSQPVQAAQPVQVAQPAQMAQPVQAPPPVQAAQSAPAAAAKLSTMPDGSPNFPGAASLKPIAAASEGLSQPVPGKKPNGKAPPPAAASGSKLEQIRKALLANQLDEADRLLAEERGRLNSGGDALQLAELTGLAGDHAAAAGRLGGAKWLWRLALQRFGSAGAMDSPAARAVAERLRLADN